MIRVNLLYRDAYAERWQPLLDAADLLVDIGIKLLDRDARPADLLIVPSDMLAELEAQGDLRVRGPLVVWERADQETVASENRHLIRQERVVGWLKDHLIRDVNLNNAPHFAGYWHFGLLPRVRTNYAGVIMEPHLDAIHFDKLATVHNIPAIRQFDRFKEAIPLPPAKRDIDVLFIGTVDYSVAPLRQHRESLCAAMGRLTQYKTVMAINTTRVIEQRVYDSLMKRAKIFVSPYGFSLSSWKDWEAIYSGCVLMKPDSHQQVNYRPDIFADNSSYVAVGPDFTDLEDRVADVLGNYGYHYERSLAARESFQVCRDQEGRALDFQRLVDKWADAVPATLSATTRKAQNSKSAVTTSSLASSRSLKANVHSKAETESIRASLAEEFTNYFDTFNLSGPEPSLGFGADYYLTRIMFQTLKEATAFVDAGSSGSDALGLVARNFTIPCFSCELHPDSYATASRNLTRYSNAQVFNEPSSECLDMLYGKRPELMAGRPVFWLDGHSCSTGVSLAKAIARITEASGEFCIAIHGFEVPGNPRFQFVSYDDGKLNWDYIRDGISAVNSYTVIYPNYRLRTSLDAEPRGWIMILSGTWDVIPPGLAEQYTLLSGSD